MLKFYKFIIRHLQVLLDPKNREEKKIRRIS